MWIVSEDSPEERRAGRQDELVRLDLSVATGERHVEKILFIAYFAECDTNVALEIVPSETKLLRRPHGE